MSIIFNKNLILHFNLLNILIYMFVGYMFGSIPCGYLYSKKHGIDIFSVGSKNPGSTNVGRILGKKAGRLVFMCDLLKTIVPITICSFIYFYFNNEFLKGNASFFNMFKLGVFIDMLSSSTMNEAIMYGNIRAIKLITGLGVILGHNWSIFTHFKGGKGITVTVATIFCFSPVLAIILYLIFKIICKITNYVSLSSIITLVIMAILAFILTWWHIYPFRLKYSEICPFLILIYAIIGILRHKSNIKKLLNGTENKIK